MATKAAARAFQRPPLAAVRGRVSVGLAVAGLVTAYLATRLSFVDRFPYFIDEGAYGYFSYKASHSVHDLFITYTLGREPLQTWLSIPLVKLGFGPLTAVRLVSVASGLLTAVVVGLLARRLGGNWVGWVAAALCVVLPFFVVNHGIGTVEPLVTLIMAAALYLQVELARRPDLRVGALLGLVLAAGVLTKQSTRPALALIPLSLLCFDWSEDDRRRRLRLWLGGIGIAALMVIAAGLLLRASSRYPELEAHRGTPLYTVRSVHDALTDPFESWRLAWSAYRPAIFEYVTIPLLVTAAAGGLLSWRRQPRLTAVLLTWIALPFVISMSFATLPFPRHVMYLMPPAIVLMAYALVEGGRWAQRVMSRRVAAVACTAAAALLLLPALRLDWRMLAHPASAHYPGLDDRYVTGTAGGGPWPDVADAIRRRAGPGRVLILDAGNNATIVRLLLGIDSRFVFVGRKSPEASRTQFAITDELPAPFIDQRSLALIRTQRLALVGRFPRPRGGAVVKLYQRNGPRP